MRQTIWLPLTEPKCIGSACRNPKPCAARDIPQEKGRPLKDYSQPLQYIAECSAPMFYKHIPYSKAKKPEPQPVVREWIGS